MGGPRAQLAIGQAAEAVDRAKKRAEHLLSTIGAVEVLTLAFKEVYDVSGVPLEPVCGPDLFAHQKDASQASSQPLPEFKALHASVKSFHAQYMLSRRATAAAIREEMLHPAP